MFVPALIGVLLLISILPGSAADYTLVVLPPQSDEIQQVDETQQVDGDIRRGTVVTFEPFINIEKAEMLDRILIANTPITYTYKTSELGIYEIVVTGKENENYIALRVEVLKGTSKLVNMSAPGMVYKNLNIWAGTKKIKEVLIRFKVDNSWITDNDLAGSDVKMVKWDGSKWVQLETLEMDWDNTYTFYEAKTDALYVFAITGLKGELVPIATQAIEITETPAKATVPSPSEQSKWIPGFELILAILMFSLIYRLRRH